MVRVGVQDTGIGIASEQLPRLFKPFELIDGQPGRCVSKPESASPSLTAR